MVENGRPIPGQEVKQAPQTPESGKPLTLTLSREVQSGLLEALKRDLKWRTNLETDGVYVDQPEMIKQNEELRGVLYALFKNLNICFLDDESYLQVGLLDLIPNKNKRLNEWATMDAVTDDEKTLRRTAQYFQAEESKKKVHKTPNLTY